MDTALRVKVISNSFEENDGKTTETVPFNLREGNFDVP